MEKLSENRFRIPVSPEKVMRIVKKIWMLVLRKTKSPGEAYICLLVVAGCLKKEFNIELESDTEAFIEDVIDFWDKSKEK